MEGFTHIGDQLRGRGDDEGAVNFYQRALQRNADDERARYALAQICEAHGNYGEAISQYQMLIKLAPKNGEYQRAIARVYIKTNQPANAKEAYEKALDIDSDDSKAMNGLGISLDYLGQHDAAQKAYKSALDEDENDETALNNLAHSYVLVGAYDSAIKLLEPHLKDKAATPALRQNLAEAYGMAGMDADAERVARIDLNPEQVRHNLAYYHSRRVELSLEPKLYADLGSFATEAMADARADEIKTTYAKDVAGLIIATQSEVKAINGTPSFTLRISGFARADKLNAFCAKLKKDTIACKAHGA